MTLKYPRKKLKLKHELNKLLEYLENNKEKEINFLGEEKDESYKEFLKKTTPKRAKTMEGVPFKLSMPVLIIFVIEFSFAYSER